MMSSASQSSKTTSKPVLSADMTTKKWRSLHEEVPSCFSFDKSEQREEPNSVESSFWNSFMSERKRESPENGRAFESSVVSLSERSLEMCTENLGSETGSEEYSSDGDCDVSDGKDLMDNYFVATIKKPQPRSFPPPISSLGNSLMMQSRRDNGRLVVEAVSVLNKHNFVAERENGRLVLSLLNGSVDEEGDCDAEGEQFEMEIEDYVRKGRDDMDKEKMSVSTTLLGAHNTPRKVVTNKLLLMETKPIVLPNKNPTWGTKIEEGDIITPVTRSLPPTQMAVAKRSSVGFPNVYWSYWRTKGYVSDACKSVDDRTNRFVNGEDLSKEYVAAMRNGCKEPNRSLSPWKPRCIATT